MIAMFFGTVLPWVLIGVGTWLAYQLMRQNGRILLRLESIEKKVRQRPSKPKRHKPAGLPIGALAPDFELPDLTGERRSLAHFRGKSLLLVFFNPQCGFCTQMAAEIAALPTHGTGGRPIPLIVTTGDAEENRTLVERFGLSCVVLLQQEMQVASQYRVAGTPMGYLVDGEGRIAGDLAAGAEALLQLAEPGAAANPKKSQHKAKQPDPSLARSRLKRDGLKGGTPAPEFTLPSIAGGEISLAEFRGHRVLLVFSDPECGPCDEIALRLQELHEERSDLQVLVVSRRDAEATRIKARTIGLSYPIALQKQWEVSLKYAMFATPIGYLIDEQGIIVRDVAVGVQPILDLPAEAAALSNDDSSSMLFSTIPMGSRSQELERQAT